MVSKPLLISAPRPSACHGASATLPCTGCIDRSFPTPVINGKTKKPPAARSGPEWLHCPLLSIKSEGALKKASRLPGQHWPSKQSSMQRCSSLLAYCF